MSEKTEYINKKNASGNAEYRSDAFSMLMRQPDYALDVYNAMNNTHYDNPDDLDIFLLENGISLTIRNDASFIIYNCLCIYEHQASFNPNMPIRELIYFSNLIMRLIRTNRINVYGQAQVKMPTPQFVVFYNGADKRPEREQFRLTDAFDEIKGEPPIELICSAININPDMNRELREKSYVLNGYCIFVEKVRQYIKQDITLEEALDISVGECVREHILEEFFREHGNEVKKMETLDFTFETRIELEKRDARLEGIREGELKGELKGQLNALLLFLKRFNPSQELINRLRAITDMDTIDLLLQKAIACHSIEEFTEYMNQL